MNLEAAPRSRHYVDTAPFDPGRSDVDFLVEYPEGYDFGPWLRRRHEFRRALEALLGRRVDLVGFDALSDRDFSDAAASTRSLIFDASDLPQVA